MKNSKLRDIALRGFIAGSLISTTAAMVMAEGGIAAAPEGEDNSKKEQNQKFFEVHACAGLNVCKGLGGCKVTEKKLTKLAKKMGVPADKAGAVHGCAGLNECKGLGGCKVSTEKYLKLKKKVAAKTMEAAQ